MPDILAGAMMSDVRLEQWFLTKEERGNPDTCLDARHPDGQAWSTGNHVRPVVHGRAYFAELYERVNALGVGDLLFFVDWRGDPDERLTDDEDSSVVTTFMRAAQRGAEVRGLLWRAHWRHLGYHSHQAKWMHDDLAEVGAQALRDMRVRVAGSHHQKFVVLRHREHPERDIAYVGGIDLCHGRRDGEDHRGDPQPKPIASVYGPTPAWHDVQCAIQGPAVHDVETCFRERWEDSRPLTIHPGRRGASWLLGEQLEPRELSPQAPPPPPPEGGTHAVQLLRTYPRLDPPLDFASNGERSIARGYGKAIARARELIYIEDQYLWSTEVAQGFVDALRANPGLRIVAVLPRVPDHDGPLALPPNLVGREQAMRAIREAGGDRVAFYGIENSLGRPVYVHAKVCVVDDQWCTIGSDNFNRRSWTNDSELTAAIQDTRPLAEEGSGSVAGEPDSHTGARRTHPDAFPVALRRELTAEHLGLSVDDPCLIDPERLFEAMAACAQEVEAWHASGRQGPHPQGRLRAIPMPRVRSATRPWATRLYRTVFDPDGRSPEDRAAARW